MNTFNSRTHNTTFLIMLAMFLLLAIGVQPAQAHGSEGHAMSMEGMDMQGMEDMEGMQHDMMPGMAHTQDSDKHHEIVADRPGDERQVDRTIKVSISGERRFHPGSLSVTQGDTVRFIVTNNSQIPHAFVIATAQGQQDYQQMMERMPSMPQEGNNAVTIKPGESRTLVWQFSHPGTMQFACHMPGHFAAGMVGTINVLKAR